MGEYIEGDTEDCWTNELLLNNRLREQARLETAHTTARDRQAVASNPVSRVVASVYARIYSHRLAKVSEEVDYFRCLPQPSYDNA